MVIKKAMTNNTVMYIVMYIAYYKMYIVQEYHTLP